MIRGLLIAALVFAGPPRAAAAQDLEPLVRRLTNAWASSDAAGLASFAASEGVSIEIGGARVGPLPPRQAAAALRKLFDGCETLSARAGMAKLVGGASNRAFVEITWISRVRGTTVPQRSTVFLALALERERWRVTEIRHIR